MAGYTEEETAKLKNLLEEMTPMELAETIREVDRLLQVEQEWRDAGCPMGKPYHFGNPPRRLPASAIRRHRRRF